MFSVYTGHGFISFSEISCRPISESTAPIAECHLGEDCPDALRLAGKLHDVRKHVVISSTRCRVRQQEQYSLCSVKLEPGLCMA